ncbi:transcription repressor OFP13 [Typha angustifolia]|uniref:transcription repressor OFP13 n=1 Tax=Typha angustifolia TaxID=59011 RepID=UPI003C2CE31B
MGKKGFSSLLFKLRDIPRRRRRNGTSSYYYCYPPPPSSWPWPSCKNPKTDSFRAKSEADSIYKTANSVYDASTESWLTNSAEPAGSSSSSAESVHDVAVVSGVRSERLFFEPGRTSSILDEARKASELVFKESVALTMESSDPYHDFRMAMEEMVLAHGLKDWDCLEELLAWYLRVNGKKNHEYILGAFVDLLMAFANSSSSSSPSPSPSPSSCSTITFQETNEEVEEGSGSSLISSCI